MNDSDNETPAPSEMTTVNGGEELAIVYRDGTTATIFVRQIPLKLMTAMSIALGNEAALIELYCDHAAGWCEKLTPESASAIANLGQELNRVFFLAWYRRQAIWQETLRPGTIAAIQERIEMMVAAAVVSGSSALKSLPTTV